MPENIFSQEYFINESYFINDICNSDIDLDGDNDLIICCTSNELADSLYIYYNDGIGNLDKSSICRRNGIFVLSGDIENDQFPGIITKDESSILYIKNNGDGTFGEEIILAPTKGNKVIEYITDMDFDGSNDLVYTFNAYYSKWGILKNEGELIFTDHIIYDDGLGTILFPIIGNLNNDNLPDASLTFTSDGIHVLMNNGDLTFDSLLLCSTKGYPAICALDLNPPEDILVLAPNTDELILFENMGNNVFVDRNTIPLIDALGLSEIADFNNDGYDDYCYSICWWNGCTDSIYISINDQLWSFLQPQQYYVGPIELFGTVTADMNGDSFNDIIMYGYSPKNAFKILWNDGFGSFSYENPVGLLENHYQHNNLNIDIVPNPFTEITRIKINSNIDLIIIISIVDLFGRKVKEFNAGLIKINEPVEYIWDGSDFRGQVVPQGVYILILSDSSNNIRSKKIIKY